MEKRILTRRQWLKTGALFLPAAFVRPGQCQIPPPVVLSTSSTLSPFPDMTEGWHLEEGNSSDRLAISGISGNRYVAFGALTYDAVGAGIHNHGCGFGADGTTGGLKNQNLTMFNTPSGRSFTWSLWLNVGTNVSFNRPVLTKFDYTLSPNKDYTFQGTTGSLYWIAQPSAAGGLVQLSVGTIITSAWNHCVFGYDDSAQQLFSFFNGGSKQTIACNGITNTTTINVILGQYFPAGSSASMGSAQQDEIYFWQRALLTSEVAYLWNGGSGNFAP